MTLNDLVANFTWGGLLILVLNAIHPEAAVGAVCGGLFFWSLSPEIPVWSRFWLAVASIGIGYGMGLPAARSNEYSGWAWATAGVGASLSHVVIVSLHRTANKDSPMPPWLKDMLAVLPWSKERGDDE